MATRAKVFENVQCNKGSDNPTGAAGFWCGDKHAICLAYDLKSLIGKPLRDASFAAHPPNVEVSGDIEPVKKPLDIALADGDFVMDRPTLDKVKEILDKNEALYNQVWVYANAGHGFAVRADPKNEKIMERSVEAEDQAMKWFQTQFEQRGAVA